MPVADAKMVPFAPKYLRVGEALPFGVHDAQGQLLLAAGQVIESQDRLIKLTSQALTVEEEASFDWRRRLVVTMDAMVRQNASLKQIAEARPKDEAEAIRAIAETPLNDQWEDAIAALDAALRDARPDGAWLMRALDLRVQCHRLATRRPDASLYYQIWRAAQAPQRYSAQHSLLVQLVVELAAPLLGIGAEGVERLGEAALMMNVAMVRLQDHLAQNNLPPTPAQRKEIAEHAELGARMLRACGVDDSVCRIVALHHHDSLPADVDPVIALQTQLLHRIDVFTAKLSRRKTREPMSPVQAARQACLGADGKPDAIGSALLKALGLYPPGSFVQLASGEQGVVVSRGRSPSQPLVASLISASGMPMGEPTLRDTGDARFLVKAPVASSTMKVRPIHAKVLALI
ncbi:MAG: hypothetical protein JNJ71_06140 [Rubrivivax sp.]|nr:hypothetical protein [Rubrivivax sp.]